MDAQTRSVMFGNATDKWPTPRVFGAELVARYRLNLDVCADALNALCPRYFTEAQNGILQDWSGSRVWCNPPYGESEKPCAPGCDKKRCQKRGFHRDRYFHGCPEWVAMCSAHALDGGLAVMLLPARTETRWWHSHIWDAPNRRPRPGVDVDFLKGRLTFGSATTPAPFPSVVAVFGDPT